MQISEKIFNLNSKFKLSLLGNISGNKYTMIPSDRQTEFGSFNEALRLTIYFEGQEIDNLPSKKEELVDKQ